MISDSQGADDVPYFQSFEYDLQTTNHSTHIRKWYNITEFVGHIQDKLHVFETNLHYVVRSSMMGSGKGVLNRWIRDGSAFIGRRVHVLWLLVTVDIMRGRGCTL